MKLPTEMQRKKSEVLGGVRYRLIKPSKIREHILSMANNEWDPEDFIHYGEDLRKATWKLERVRIEKVRMRPELIRSRDFRKELRPRIANHLNLIKAGRPMPPLVLRGEDFLIFDGYARLHALRHLGAEECLAYVGRKRSDHGPG